MSALKERVDLLSLTANFVGGNKLVERFADQSGFLRKVFIFQMMSASFDPTT